MITISRRDVRRLRSIFRRHVLGITTRGAVPPLVFRAEGDKLLVQHQHGDLAVRYVQDGGFTPTETIALPLDALAEIEGRDGSPVVLESVRAEATVVRWEDHGIPQTCEHTVPAVDSLTSFPRPPSRLETASPGLLDALAEAVRTCSEEGTRYALDCILLRGSVNDIVATDGHQLLIQGGFQLPWSDDLVVKQSLVFGCKELNHDDPVSIGRTESHVVFKSGAWTVFLQIQRDRRYPSVDQIIPDETSAAARLRLDRDDAAFLESALGSLPGADALYAPATVDLNGRVAIRARGEESERPTELVLSRSDYTGTPIRFQTNREFIGRAILLGFSELAITDADSPVVCRHGARTYCWQTLSKDSAVQPSADVTRIESGSTTSSSASQLRQTPKASHSVSENPRPNTSETGTNGKVHERPTPEHGTMGLGAAIEEAEALHKALAAMNAQSRRLVMTLRKHRRRERLVAATLASLKQLKLQEVAE
jgi:hypothetical protein